MSFSLVDTFQQMCCFLLHDQFLNCEDMGSLAVLAIRFPSDRGTMRTTR
jgi:hypothetical protein